MRAGTATPRSVESSVMTSSAEAAPSQTVNRKCIIASIVAMRKVLSPISERPMRKKAALNASELFAKVEVGSE
jgi:hypothetical protein